MKFIVDAQLPRSLAALLRDNGHDAIHTTDLAEGNDTVDAVVNALSLAEHRVVISKDGDFYNSFTETKEPFKLLHIKTGNISNANLLGIFTKNLAALVEELNESDVVTVDQRHIIALS